MEDPPALDPTSWNLDLRPLVKLRALVVPKVCVGKLQASL